MVAVLFDLEGTLVQSPTNNPEVFLEFRARTREKLLALGIPISELEGVTKSTLMRNKVVNYVEKHFDEEEAKLFRLEMDKFLKDYEISWAYNSSIFPDTIPTLNMLRGCKYEMGVITGTSRGAADHMLSINHIAEFFQVLITREDVKRLKPDPEGIRLAIKALDARTFFFIGDLLYDYMAAKEAGGIPIIVNRDASKELKFHADYVVTSLIEIPDLIQRLVINEN
jgi:HAD superfamily hydrolase (TIGR01549 family)